MLEEVDSLFFSSSRIVFDANRVFGVESLNFVATTLVTRCRIDRLLLGGGDSYPPLLSTFIFSTFAFTTFSTLTTAQLESALSLPLPKSITLSLFFENVNEAVS